MTDKDTARFEIRLPTATVQKLRTLSKLQDKPIAAVIRGALSSHLRSLKNRAKLPPELADKIADARTWTAEDWEAIRMDYETTQSNDLWPEAFHRMRMHLELTTR